MISIMPPILVQGLAEGRQPVRNDGIGHAHLRTLRKPTLTGSTGAEARAWLAPEPCSG